jgi:prolyl oligopeptidase
MEDDRSDETSWVKAQNEVTYGYLNQIPFQMPLKTRWRIMELRENRCSL